MIFLTRRPLESLSSLFKLTHQFYEGWSMAKITSYYVDRLQQLGCLADILQGSSKAISLTYEQLIDQPSSSLQRLQAFLGMNVPFSEKYSVQSFTGKRGDPSDKIFSGSIYRGKMHKIIPIDNDLLNEAGQAYSKCQKSLKAIDNEQLTSSAKPPATPGRMEKAML